jgi:hypothetical protein
VATKTAKAGKKSTSRAKAPAVKAKKATVRKGPPKRAAKPAAKAKPKPAAKARAASTQKTAAKPKPAPTRKEAAKPKAPAKPKAAAKPKQNEPLDLTRFPTEAVTQSERWICLACVGDVFLRHLGLAQKTAQAEIKRYTPSLEELRAERATRPFYDAVSEDGHCPYCASPSKWHARLTTYRIESGKATDAARRELMKSLPSTGGKFAILEEKATQQQAFFEWLEAASVHLDFDDPAWLMQASMRYLGRKEPKVDWHQQFAEVRTIRRSRFLEEGWEIDTGRLFLAPMLFDELLLVQYLLSRSHKAGGLTFEGRYTLAELFARLRNAGYLRAVNIAAANPSDAIEKLLEHLSGGEAAVKFYHIVDRRDFLEKTKLLESQRPPRAKLGER